MAEIEVLTLFSKRARDSHESPQTCDSQFLAPQSAIHKKGVQYRFAQIRPSKV